MIVGTAIAITYMFNTFVTASEFEEYITEAYYESYYQLLDRKYAAEDRGNDELAKEYSRRLEKLKAKICAQDPEWERCDGNSE